MAESWSPEDGGTETIKKESCTQKNCAVNKANTEKVEERKAQCDCALCAF